MKIWLLGEIRKDDIFYTVNLLSDYREKVPRACFWLVTHSQYAHTHTHTHTHIHTLTHTHTHTHTLTLTHRRGVSVVLTSRWSSVWPEPSLILRCDVSEPSLIEGQKLDAVIWFHGRGRGRWCTCLVFVFSLCSLTCVRIYHVVKAVLTLIVANWMHDAKIWAEWRWLLFASRQGGKYANIPNPMSCLFPAVVASFHNIVCAWRQNLQLESSSDIWMSIWLSRSSSILSFSMSRVHFAMSLRTYSLTFATWITSCCLSGSLLHP